MPTESFQVSFIVELAHGESTLVNSTVDQSTSLLQLMHDTGLPVRKACKNGGCGVCRCRLKRGDITYHQREPFALWEQEKADGIILPCIAFATSSLILDQLSFDKKSNIHSKTKP